MAFRIIASIIFLFTIIHEGCTKNCTHDIPHGHVTWWCSTNAGNMCPYSCDKGYEKNPDVPWISCSSSGEWRSFIHVYHTGAEDICLPKLCPQTIPNGKLSDTCDATVGTTCNYSCEMGYQKNAANISCDFSKNWSTNRHLLCTNSQQCPYEIEHGNLDITCRRIPGESCNYTCHEGYLPSATAPTMEITCGPSLIWSRSLSSLCEEIHCPSVIPHGVVSSGCSREYKTLCYSYDCDSGYTKPPSVPTLSCNASGQWYWGKHQGNPCARTDELCPSNIRNGHIIGHCHRQHGATCTYSCDSGCTNDRSVSWLNCKNNSMWDKNTDTLCTCRPTTAVPHLCPRSIPNGHIDRECNRRPFTTCHYKCDDGCYQTYGGALYCTGNSYWKNKNSACRCDARHMTTDVSITCPQTIPHGYISAICSRVPFQTCDYTCDNGCRKTYSSLYCTDPGSWISGGSACECQGLNPTQQPHTNSKSIPITIGAMVGVVALFITIFVCGYIRFKKRRQQRRTNSCCQPARHVDQPTVTGTDFNGTSNITFNPLYTLSNQTDLYTSIQLPPTLEENSYTPLCPPNGELNIQSPKPPEYSSIAQPESRENPPPYELVIAYPADFRI